MDAPFDLAFHYSGFFQDFEVLGYGGLGGSKLAAEVTGAAGLALRQRMNHRTTRAVGQSVKDEIESRAGIHRQMTIYWSGWL
jgi:hypothetical protein